MGYEAISDSPSQDGEEIMNKHALFVGLSWISMVAALAFAAVTIITKSGAFGVASLVAMLCWIGFGMLYISMESDS